MFFLSLSVFLLSWLFLLPLFSCSPSKQINKQSRHLLIPSFLSRRKELTNSVILRFIPARKLAILKSNFKTLKTKESLSNGGLPGPQKVGEGKWGLRCHGTSGYVGEAGAVWMVDPLVKGLDYWRWPRRPEAIGRALQGPVAACDGECASAAACWLRPCAASVSVYTGLGWHLCCLHQDEPGVSGPDPRALWEQQCRPPRRPGDQLW